MNATASKTTTEVLSDDAFELSQLLRDALTDGATIRIDGIEIWSPWGAQHAVSAWQNGSLSYETRSKTPGRSRTRWIKRGQSFQLEVQG